MLQHFSAKITDRCCDEFSFLFNKKKIIFILQTPINIGNNYFILLQEIVIFPSASGRVVPGPQVTHSLKIHNGIHNMYTALGIQC